MVLHVAGSRDPVLRLPDDLKHELVLIHPGREIGAGAAAWLTNENRRRHHIRFGVTADIERLGRSVRGTSIGLALSGGGVRALAHLGVYRALSEAGIPIDYVAGTSIGAVVAAQIARLGDPLELIERNIECFTSADFGRRFTVPLLSVLSLRTALPLFEYLFGRSDLADTPANPLVTVVDFTTCQVHYRRVGHAATWTRASASPPGLWPPVEVDNHLFVDGAVLDNLPVAALRRAGAARVLAVDVSRAEHFEAPTTDRPVTSWRQLADPRRSKRIRGYPTLPKMVMRLSMLASLPLKVVSQAEADRVVEPEVGALSLGDYRRSREAPLLGYDAMRRALDAEVGYFESWR